MKLKNLIGLPVLVLMPALAVAIAVVEYRADSAQGALEAVRDRNLAEIQSVQAVEASRPSKGPSAASGNVWESYVEAISLYLRDSHATGKNDVALEREMTTLLKSKPFDREGAEVFLTRYADAIAKVREGLARTDVRSPLRRELGFESDMPNFFSLRKLSLVLVLESQLAEAKGDRAGAVDRAFDLAVFGQDVYRYGGLNSVFVASVLQGRALERLGDLVASGDLDARLLDSVAARLRQLEHEQPPFADTLRDERLTTVAELATDGADGDLARLRDAGFGLSMRQGRSARPPSRVASALGRVYVWMRMAELPEAVEGIEAGFRRLERASAGPYHLFDEDSAALSSEVEARDNYFLRIPIAYLTIGHRQFVETEARIRCLTLAALVRSYRLSHNAPPPSLDLLGPTPVDPFTDEPFHYRVDGASALVWSVGPDLDDDGGASGANWEDGDVAASAGS